MVINHKKWLKESKEEYVVTPENDMDSDFIVYKQSFIRIQPRSFMHIVSMVTRIPQKQN